MADWQTVSVLCAPGVLLYCGIHWHRGHSLLAVALRGGFLIYLVGLVSVTLFPLPVTPAEIESLRELPREYQRQSNLVPFASIVQTLGLPLRPAVIQLAGNLVMLFPLGYLAPILWPSVNTWRRALGVVVGASVLVEAAQFLVSLALGGYYKSVDIDDVILNVAGGLAGYLVYRLVEPLLTRFDFAPHRRSP